MREVSDGRGDELAIATRANEWSLMSELLCGRDFLLTDLGPVFDCYIGSFFPPG
jgi:hypothetical protein